MNETSNIVALRQPDNIIFSIRGFQRLRSKIRYPLLYPAPRSAEKSPASLVPCCLRDGVLRAGAEQPYRSGCWRS